MAATPYNEREGAEGKTITPTDGDGGGHQRRPRLPPAEGRRADVAGHPPMEIEADPLEGQRPQRPQTAREAAVPHLHLRVPASEGLAVSLSQPPDNPRGRLWS
jgi:hypothetical protein